METFLFEVYRTLKPGGFFLFADFRNVYEIANLHFQLGKSNFQVVEFENITSNVAEALKLASPGREALIRKLIPGLLHKASKNFAATIGSRTYKSFLTGKYQYV